MLFRSCLSPLVGRHGSAWRCLVLRSLRTEHCFLTISVSLVSVLGPTLLVEMWPSVSYYPDICRMGVICLWTPRLVCSSACFCPPRVAWGILVPPPGSEPCPLWWKHGVLTAGLARNPPFASILISGCL